MLLSLIRKDFLIIKKYVAMLLVIAFAIPVFLLRTTPQAAGILGFVYVVLFSLFMLTQYVSQKETQYPRATALLCASPYSRRLMVLSKYCFSLIVYGAGCLVFWIDTFLFPQLGAFNGKLAAAVFFVAVVFLAVYFPAQYKLGYEKTKLSFIVVIVAFPYLSAVLFKADSGIRFDFLAEVPTAVILLASFALSLVLFAASAALSVRIFEKSDLA